MVQLTAQSFQLKNLKVLKVLGAAFVVSSGRLTQATLHANLGVLRPVEESKSLAVVFDIFIKAQCENTVLCGTVPG